VAGSNPRAVPVQVPGLSNVEDIAASDDFSCAVVGGGVFCWGTTTVPQLFDGSATTWSSPQPVPGLTDIDMIDAGWETVCARNINRLLYCWGNNQYGIITGKLGTNSTAAAEGPGAAVLNLSNVSEFSVGSGHVCAVTGQSAVCWGSDASGQLGDGGGLVSSSIPVTVDLGGFAFTAVAAGLDHSCGIAGQLYCWGRNDYRAVGVAASGNHPSPRQLSTPTAPAVLELGYATTHVARVTGIDGLYPFGRNDAFQLGNNLDSTSLLPGTEVLAGTTVVDVAMSQTWGCALDDTGAVYCWGTPPNGLPVLLDGQLQPAEKRVAAFLSPLVGIPAEVCGDGVDNDQNGSTDCDDSTCLPATANSATGVVISNGPAFDEFDGNTYEPLPECITLQGDNGGIDKVFRWTAPSSGRFTITGNDGLQNFHDYVFYVLDSCDRTQNTMLACYSDAVAMGGPMMTTPANEFDAVQGTDYYIVVDLAAGSYTPNSTFYTFDAYEVRIDPAPP
jgi:alpha-tubulin suppressor-like RCC1 family protein